MDMEKLFERLMAKMDADRTAAQEDLLAKMDANQAKAEAKIDACKERMEVDRKDLKEMMKMMHANQAKAETCHKDFLARMDAHWNAWREIMNANHDETVACQEMEARLIEKTPTSSDKKLEAAQKAEAPEENATVMPVEEPKKKWRRDRRLGAERRRHKQKISTRENRTPQKKLAVARRGTSHRPTVARQREKKIDKKMPRCATVAQHIRDIFRPNTTRKGITVRKDRARENVVRETPKRTEENRRWKYPECKNGTRYKGLKQLLQGSKQMMDPTPNGIEGWSQGKRTHQRIGGI
jgi:hypothetical protein